MSNNRITALRRELEGQKGQRKAIENSITGYETAVKELDRSLRRHQEAQVIIRAVGQKTQQQLQYHIGDITSLALEAVFDDPYVQGIEFVQRRNKTECDLFFLRDGNRVEPLDDAGGGANDVAAFALRVASWSMQRPRSRNTLWLDEPFKHLKGEIENQRALEMIHKLSVELNLQIVMISDERISREATIANTDRLFVVGMRNGISEVVIS